VSIFRDSSLPSKKRKQLKELVWAGRELREANRAGGGPGIRGSLEERGGEWRSGTGGWRLHSSDNSRRLETSNGEGLKSGPSS